MKTTILILIFATMFASGATAQATVVGTTAGAKIIAPISLANEQPLNFGTMAVLASTSGTCMLSTANVRTAAGGVNLSATPPAPQTALFNVGGNASTVYIITLPSTITISDGSGHNMTINALLAHPASSGADILTGTLSAGGTDSFTVGGTLLVSAGQAPNAYSGTFDVTVAYY